ncbi:hypothetical protein H072_2966 [Dactylellina haptotyla CBS 200.50]|uniref:Uncharacterized protein n=1 Tax=Dactylellina haptotyla (strain CBS 200.50) TaxID=1284197 RepID=S8C5S1_DACHA|nr:hypothetical protein H072_2966 [Dactylellina haptotyla CBS 200.50]
MSLGFYDTLSMNISIFDKILSSTLKPKGDYKWPDLCQGLGNTYVGPNADFQYFDVCSIYPDLIQGLNAGTFDANQTFIDELTNYRIKPIQNVPTISKDITTETLSFLLRTCKGFDCNTANQYVMCDPNLIVTNSGQSLSHMGVMACKTAICMTLRTYVSDDPDIGGIGVFISYILQLVLVVIMTIYVLCKLVLHERRVIVDDMHSPFTGSSAFPHTLQEFQKVQSWFVGSLVIAAAIRQIASITNISVTDFLFLGGISVNGVVLICYMNAALLLLGRKSWYIYGISWVTFILCSAFVIYTNMKRGERVNNVLPTLYFCRNDLTDSRNSLRIIDWVTLVHRLPESTIYIAWGFCTFIQLGCLFWMLEWDLKTSPGFRDWIRTRLGQIMLWFIILIITFAFLAILALQLAMLYNFWGIVDRHSWSFGQIIAVTIWFPLIIDYIHDYYKEKKGYVITTDGYPKDEESNYSTVPLNPGSGGAPSPAHNRNASSSTFHTSHTHAQSENRDGRRPTHDLFNNHITISLRLAITPEHTFFSALPNVPDAIRHAGYGYPIF